MKLFKKFAFLLLPAFLVLGAQKTYALMHVGVSVPISYSMTGVDSSEKAGLKLSSYSGLGLNVVIPGGMMLRYDQFTQNFTTGAKNEIALFSIGYRLDLITTPLHLAGAFGLGTDEYSYGSVTYKANSPSQIYLEIGYNIIPLLDISLGMHRISGKKISYNDGSKSRSDMSAQAFSLGLNFGF